jgi:hypothetical protein
MKAVSSPWKICHLAQQTSSVTLARSTGYLAATSAQHWLLYLVFYVMETALSFNQPLLASNFSSSTSPLSAFIELKN